MLEPNSFDMHSIDFPPNSEAVILLSGGVDSAACLALFSALGIRSTCLFVNYGHDAAIQESRAAAAISRFYRVSLHQITVSGLRKWGAGFVPGRNAFLLHIALMAVTFQKGLIASGIHAGTTYSDCSAYFLRQMQASFDIYTNGRIWACAPFLHWKKPDIWEYCLSNKVPVELAYSCEAGTDPPCGECLSCLDRGHLI